MPAAYLSTNLSLPEKPQIEDPKLLAQLLPLHNAIKGLQIALDQYTQPIAQDSAIWSTISPLSTVIAGNLNRLYRQAAVNITAGQLMSLNGSGQWVLADAATSIKCRAWATLAITAGSYGEGITFGGCINFGAGLTPGNTYYLGNAGALAAAPGALSQAIGFAVTSGILVFQPQLV